MPIKVGYTQIEAIPHSALIWKPLFVYVVALSIKRLSGEDFIPFCVVVTGFIPAVKSAMISRVYFKFSSFIQSG